MLSLPKPLLYSVVLACACTSSSPDLDSEISNPQSADPDPSNPDPSSEAPNPGPGDDAVEPQLQIDVISDGSLGAIQVFSEATFEVVATCTLDCTVPLNAGEQYSLIASSPSTAAISGVCSSTTTCTFTAGAGLQTAAATFRRDPVSKEEWAVLLPEVIFTAAFDNSGNLIARGNTTLFKLSPTGSTIWQRPFVTTAIATGAGDTIYVHAGTTIQKLDANGIQIWSRDIPLGARDCPRSAAFTRCIAVAADDSVVVRGKSQLARWDADGLPSWAISHRDDLNFAVAIDASGVIYTTAENFNIEPRDFIRFAADGIALDPVEDVCPQYHAMLFPVSGGVGITCSGHSNAYGIGSRSTREAGDTPTGMAGTPTGERGWAFHVASFPLEWRMIRSGTTRWEVGGDIHAILPGSFDSVGTQPNDIAASANGRFALVGLYDDFDPNFTSGWVKSFAP